MVCGLEDLGKESVEEEEEGRSTWPARMEELAQMKNKQVFMELWMGDLKKHINGSFRCKKRHNMMVAIRSTNRKSNTEKLELT